MLSGFFSRQKTNDDICRQDVIALKEKVTRLQKQIKYIVEDIKSVEEELLEISLICDKVLLPQSTTKNSGSAVVAGTSTSTRTNSSNFYFTSTAQNQRHYTPTYQTESCAPPGIIHHQHPNFPLVDNNVTNSMHNHQMSNTQEELLKAEMRKAEDKRKEEMWKEEKARLAKEEEERKAKEEADRKVKEEEKKKEASKRKEVKKLVNLVIMASEEKICCIESFSNQLSKKFPQISLEKDKLNSKSGI